MLILAYILGSIPSAVWIGKRYYGVDIREHGSKNAGTTNMLRVLGKRAAIPVFVLDFFKGFAAVSLFSIMRYDPDISSAWLINLKILGVFAAVLGHIFPIFADFKGGKGVLSTATMALILAPIPFAILLTVFIVIVAISKYVSLGSVTGAIFFPVALYSYMKLFFPDAALPLLAALSSIILAILIVWCHRENLERISNRTERKLSFKKKPEVETASVDEEDADETDEKD